MLLLFVNKSSNVWKRCVHSVYRACLSWTFYEFIKLQDLLMNFVVVGVSESMLSVML